MDPLYRAACHAVDPSAGLVLSMIDFLKQKLGRDRKSVLLSALNSTAVAKPYEENEQLKADLQNAQERYEKLKRELAESNQHQLNGDGNFRDEFERAQTNCKMLEERLQEAKQVEQTLRNKIDKLNCREGALEAKCTLLEVGIQEYKRGEQTLHKDIQALNRHVGALQTALDLARTNTDAKSHKMESKEDMVVSETPKAGKDYKSGGKIWYREISVPHDANEEFQIPAEGTPYTRESANGSPLPSDESAPPPANEFPPNSTPVNDEDNHGDTVSSEYYLLGEAAGGGLGHSIEGDASGNSSSGIANPSDNSTFHGYSPDSGHMLPSTASPSTFGDAWQPIGIGIMNIQVTDRSTTQNNQ